MNIYKYINHQQSTILQYYKFVREIGKTFDLEKRLIKSFCSFRRLDVVSD